MRRSTSPEAAVRSRMRYLEQHVHVLEAAYEEERGQRDQLEKKYARLKRRFLRLERAHAKLIVTQAAAHRSAGRSSRHEQLHQPEPDRSPVHVARSSLDADIIDLTNTAHEEASDVNLAIARHSGLSPPTRVALADDYCAESPESTHGGDESSEFPTPPARGGEGMTRRQLLFLREQLGGAPASREAFGTSESSDSGVRVASTGMNASISTRIGAVSRPRPRLGPVDSPERRIRREPEQDRDYERSLRRRTGALTASPSSSPASSPTTINSSPRSSGGHDNDEAASIALAQYLQQQENIAAFEEYTARRQAAEEAASNQFEYTDSALTAEYGGGAGSLAGREIDPDNMTYDELLRLGDENGDVRKERWRQMAVQVISCLPTHRWRGGGDNLDASCIVCQYNFVENDRALTLPCAHVFHEECVDGWIRENNSCPLCKMEIVPM